MIELSIHLITYNNEKHIEETLKSVLKQKVDFDYEIVVGDDCSTDNTLRIISQYEVKYPYLFKIKKNKTQLGILKNFKTTLDRCEARYIFDLAGDDILNSKYALQKMVNVLKNNDSLGFVDSGFDELFEKNGKVKYFSNKKTLQLTKNEYKEQVLLGHITPIGICFNKNHLYQFVDFDTYLDMKITIDDYPILVDLIMNTNFEIINESMHIYRIHDHSYSHKKSFENHYFLKSQMKNLFNFFNKKYNYEVNTTKMFYNNYHKELLFLAGYFEKREFGKKIYKKIKSKSLKDYIHYYASQNSFFRKLISLFSSTV